MHTNDRPLTRPAKAIPNSARDASERRRWIALVVLCAGFLMIILDQTIVNVRAALDQRDLRFSQSSLAWVVNAYLIAFGGLLLLAGRLGDLIGRRRVFHAGKVTHLVLAWTHPASRRQLRSIQLRLYRGAKLIGSITIAPLTARLTPHGTGRADQRAIAGEARRHDRNRSAGAPAPPRADRSDPTARRRGHRHPRPTTARPGRRDDSRHPRGQLTRIETNTPSATGGHQPDR